MHFGTQYRMSTSSCREPLCSYSYICRICVGKGFFLQKRKVISTWWPRDENDTEHLIRSPTVIKDWAEIVSAFIKFCIVHFWRKRKDSTTSIYAKICNQRALCDECCDAVAAIEALRASDMINLDSIPTTWKVDCLYFCAPGSGLRRSARVQRARGRRRAPCLSH